MDDPLFYVRALHFAATLSVAGVVFFIVGIGEPALRSATDNTRVAFAIRSRLAWIASIVSLEPCCRARRGLYSPRNR